MPTADLLVLASSRKRGGRCIAGWDLDNERWLRPVSPTADGTLELDHCGVDGRWPEVFDVVRVELDAPQPTEYQPENWVIAAQPWQLLEQAEPLAIRDDLRALTDHEDWLLNNTDRRVQGAALRENPAASSLVLVRPSALTWRIETAPWGDRQRKADFEIDGRGVYDFAVTDISAFGQLQPLVDGSYPRSLIGIDDASDVFLTVSLAEPYEQNDLCYKLVAAVVEIPG